MAHAVGELRSPWEGAQLGSWEFVSAVLSVGRIARSAANVKTLGTVQATLFQHASRLEPKGALQSTQCISHLTHTDWVY